jgi:16S rRNA A1518/A1519 N6-dimethyltransferase RsmA/KsgA/DIM1 with predicted DNA glycosylase/AP lyase activity
MALRASGRIERTIGGEVFWPRPSVASALLHLKFLPWVLLSALNCVGGDARTGVGTAAAAAAEGMLKSEAAGVQVFLQKIFSQRRKTLRATLKPSRIPEELSAFAELRAEDLTACQLLELYRGLNRTSLSC